MNKRIIAMSIVLSLSVSLYAESDNNLRINSSYILPVEDSLFNSSLILGIGAEFWGIFEFVANSYFEIDYNQEIFIEKFQTPNVISAGIGMNIPMGGFYFKSDYQRLFSITENSSEISLSNYSDSYKLGIGIEITEHLEVEGFYRFLFERGEQDQFYEDRQGYLGAGLTFKL